jgi:hypothetical protein
MCWKGATPPLTPILCFQTQPLIEDVLETRKCTLQDSNLRGFPILPENIALTTRPKVQWGEAPFDPPLETQTGVTPVDPN